ncbi:MAG: MBL fold metallo-hydrolase, partial [Pseudomonadales bacterium]|nr:MBL fold metallo-hydrolase [Pseudomonadales bacterium]
MSLDIKSFFDETTSSFSHVLSDAGKAAIIDPVLDFDPVTARVFTDGASKIVDYIRTQDLELVWILETHAHADRLTAATWIQQQLGGKTGIGQGITQVQERFREIYNLAEFPADGSQFGHLFTEGEEIELGNVRGQVISTPGHTS